MGTTLERSEELSGLLIERFLELIPGGHSLGGSLSRHLLASWEHGEDTRMRRD